MGQREKVSGYLRIFGRGFTLLPAVSLAVFAAGEWGWGAFEHGSGTKPHLSVWTVVETRRVLREEKPRELSPPQLAAARGEWESFQVLLRSTKPVSGLTVEVSPLTGPSGAEIGREHIRIFRQHYFHITQGTYRNDEFVPGWYPDPLIPSEHPLTRQPLQGGKYLAMPFDLPAEETHGFWIDLYVPEDRPAGLYRGTSRIRQNGEVVAEFAVEIRVWDFILPRVSTMKTAFGSPAARLREYYRLREKEQGEAPPGDWEMVERQCAELVSRHRINATPPGEWLRPVAQPDGSFAFSSEQVKALKGFVATYHVNAIQIPHPSSVVKDPVQEKPRLVAWLRAFDVLATELGDPNIVLYIYLRDEPNDPQAYEYVRQWGRAIRETNTVVKVLVVEQPQPQNPAWGDLYGAVDIWCPLFSLFEEAPALARLVKGETIWTYTALCQGKKTPWWHIDYPLLHYRVPAWISWRFGITGLLYWGGMCYWRQVDDPWEDSWTYGRQQEKRSLIYHGEGTLAYPARPVGYDGIVCSLRLKALRDAIEDYEYLAILERLGKKDQAMEVALPLAKNWFEWEPDPTKYLDARERLAELILASQQRLTRQ